MTEPSLDVVIDPLQPTAKRSAAELDEDATEFAELCRRFFEQHQPFPAVFDDLSQWMQREERDFFFTQVNRNMLLCVRYDHENDGIDAWNLRILDRVELPLAAIPLAAAKLRNGPADIGPVKAKELGPKACPDCRLRLGLGTCAACLRHEAREGVEGDRYWIRAVLHYLEDHAQRQDPEDDRQLLLRWLAGWD